MADVAEITAKALKPVLEELGYELVEVKYRRQYNDMHLEIYIYNADGIGLDDCEKVTQAIDPVLDELNPTNDKPYILDVSSPGLDREIKTADDFRRNMGKELELKTYAPVNKQKVFEGVLTAFENGTVTITELKTDKELVFNQRDIASLTQLIKFD